MDPRKLEYFEFLDFSDIDENEREHLKDTLYSEITPDFLQLPWTNNAVEEEEEWTKVQYDEPQHVPNGPLDAQCSVSPTMVVPPQTMPSVVQQMPPVTMYSPHPSPAYSMPPSTGYQHPQNVFVSNVSNMHGYMTGHYVQPHYAAMPEPPDMTGRGHRGRCRGRNNKRNEVRLENTMVETSTAPPFNQHQQFVPIHAYHAAAAYYPQGVGSHMQHPTAQHATGSPLYITPMYSPIFSTYHHPGAQYYPPPNAHVNPIMEDQSPIITEINEMEEHQQPQEQPMYSQLPNPGDDHYIRVNETEASPNNTAPVIVNNSMDQNYTSCDEKTDDSMYNNINNNFGNNVISAEVHDFNENIKPEPPIVVSSVVTETVVSKTESNVTVIKTEPLLSNNCIETAEQQKLSVVDQTKKVISEKCTVSNSVVTVPTKVVSQKPVEVEKPPVTVNNVQPHVKQEVIVDNNVNKPTPQTMPDSKQDLSTTSTEPEQHQQVAAPVPVPPQTTGKSWASLFNKSGHSPSALNVNQVITSNDTAKSTPNLKPQVSNSPFAKHYEDKHVEKSNNEFLNTRQRSSSLIGEFLSKYNLDFRTVSLQPRGLTNRSNYCYINSILQALLACPPFYNLLVALPHHRPKRKNVKSSTPILNAMIDFVGEFTPLSAEARLNRKEKGQRKDNIDIICGTSFEPAQIYKILNGIRTDTFIVEGRQEDAEEFFGCLLNGLNDEMLELTKQFEEQKHQSLSNGDIATNGETHEPDDVEWTVMGPKNKGSITRRAEFGRTPVSDIFRGQVRSRVHRMGDQITDNVQPFFTLQLDIEKPVNVYEALEQLVNKDKLEGVTCWKTNKQVEAWQQVTIEELPAVLVLHFKCFNYKLDTCSKIIKALEFPIDLKIDSKLLSSKAKYTVKQKQYKLFAVVYHDGKEASKGHYLTDAFHVGYGGWVRYDDSTVKAVQESQVLHPNGARVPYLLFYRRNDTIGNQQQQNAKKD